MNRWITLFAAFALALLPAAAAEPVPGGVFSAATVEWDGAGASAEKSVGSLVALQNRLPVANELLAPGAQVPIEDSHFVVVSDRVTIRIVHADAYSENPAFTTALPPPVGPLDSATIHDEESNYTAVQMDGAASRSDRALYLFPLADCGATLVAAGAVAQASADPQVAADSFFDNRDNIVRDISKAIQVTPKAGRDLLVTGCFVLVFWEWDASWTAAEGQGSFYSGKHNGQGVSDPTGKTSAAVTESEAQQVYVTVQNGIFSIRGNDKRPTLAFLPSASLSLPNATLSHANGDVAAGGIHVEDDKVDLHGDLGLTLTHGDSSLLVDVSGIRGMEVNGQPVAVSSVVASPGGGLHPGLAVGLVAAVLVPSAVAARPTVRAVRRHRVSKSVARSQGHFCSLRFGEAVAAAQKAVRIDASDPGARFRLGQALAQVGDSGGRRLNLTWVIDTLSRSGKEPDLLAEACYQEAEGQAADGEDASAMRLLRRAMALEPLLGAEAERSRFLAPLLERIVDADSELQVLVRP